MSTTDPRILDLTAFDNHDDTRARADGGDLHTLRLALDLQLDAMLLTLGASAQAESRQGGPRKDGDGVPWRRWLGEDLELARTLAAALLEGDATAVPGLGGSMADIAVETALEQLVARYSSMERLLDGVLERPHRGQAWRTAAVDALSRCRSRLDELHQHRREVIAAAPARPGFLPGELLG